MWSLLDFFNGRDMPASIVELLEVLPYEQLVEIDYQNDRVTALYRVEGKYYGSHVDGVHSDMFDFVVGETVHPDDREAFLELMDPATMSWRLASSETPGAIAGHFRYKLQDGSWHWVEQCVVGDGRQGLPKGLVRCYVFDVESSYSRLSGEHSISLYRNGQDYDKLTGLLRENEFLARVESTMLRDPGARWALILVDIDHFRLFNLWYGRDKGDALLADFAARLSDEAKRLGGMAGYLGRDNFCLLVPYDQEATGALFDDLSAMVVSHGVVAGFSPMFGIAFADGQVSAHVLLDRGFVAVSSAKADFRKNICVYDPSMRVQPESEYRAIVEFLRGLKNGEVTFQLQPQCSISSGKVVGAEALACWRRADGSVVPPVDYVPALERNGFVSSLDSCIWEEACAWLRSIIDAGVKPVPVSVNVSQFDFYALDVPEHFKGLIEKHRLPASLVKIEVTESAYVENTKVVSEAIIRLRSMGFTAVMDDFGSGYSSLNTLRTLDIDVIKLDAKFLWTGEDTKRKGAHILESVISMANVLRLPIICEGVETDEQEAFLESLGCRYVQGFKYYRRMDASAFAELIADGDMVDYGGLVPKLNEQFHIREMLDENVYSDSMLNGILGAALIYSWHGDDVDIVRFNEQFYKLVANPLFEQFMNGVQKIMPERSASRLFGLLREAEERRLTGSAGELEFYRDDGLTNRYYYRFYYLGEADGGKRFYASVADVTELSLMQEQMRLISLYTSDTVVFVRRGTEGMKFSVTVHGTESVLGLSADELQDELNSGSIAERMDDDSARVFGEFIFGKQLGKPYVHFSIVNAQGRPVRLVGKVDIVDDSSSDVACILNFRVSDAPDPPPAG